MKLARAAVLGSVLVATAAFSSPALAASDGAQGGPDHQIISLKKEMYSGGGRAIHNDYGVDGTQVTKHNYITGGIGVNYFAEGELTAKQAKKLQKLVASDGLKAEQDRGPQVICLEYYGEATLTVGDVTVFAPICNSDGKLPEDFVPTMAKAAEIITSAQF